VAAHKLELWPGYMTSIRQHETDILLCCGVNHKIMRQETALEVLSSCPHRDAVSLRVRVTSLLLWVAVFVHLPNVHYLFVCNVQKNLTLQKCARSKFVFVFFRKVERMPASVILSLHRTGAYISQLECRVAGKAVCAGLVLCNFFSRAFALTQLENLHHCLNSHDHIWLNTIRCIQYTIIFCLRDLAQTICGCTCRGLWAAGSDTTVIPSVACVSLLCL
jgi:hypothetical protein